MTSKKRLRARIADLERVSHRPPTWSLLTVDFDARTVEYKGKTTKALAPVMTIPILDSSKP